MKKQKEKEVILRLRPFNMANFSGGSYYVPFFSTFAIIASAPLSLLLWLGLALPLKKEGENLDFQLIKLRIKRLVIPLIIIMFIAGLIILPSFLAKYSDILFYFLSVIWGAAAPGLVLYLSLLLSAAVLNKAQRLTKLSWFILTFVFAVILAIIAIYLLFVFEGIGYSLVVYE